MQHVRIVLYIKLNLFMKKKFIILTGALMMAVGTYFTVDSATAQNYDLLLENVEALTNRESISAQVDCSGSGSIYCPIDRSSSYKEVTTTQL